jgi:uncharacterized damage-inducible protein DinB
MQDPIPGFRGEYLSELDVVQTQLLALVDVVPAEVYGWRPAENARSLSEVLVHVAVNNFLLMNGVGVRTQDTEDLYGSLEGDQRSQITAIIRKNISLERTVTEKSVVVDLLRRSFEAVRQSVTSASEEEFESTLSFLGERTTKRRIYLRMLVHMHEHMGQTIAYARSNGIRVPWPDPLAEF